jgi:hypothetical protein
MLSSGFGGVPSTYVTLGPNTELVRVKNVIGYQFASDELRAGAGGRDLSTRMTAVENMAMSAADAVGTFDEHPPPEGMTSNTTLFDGGLSYTASASSVAYEQEPHLAFSVVADSWMSATADYEIASNGTLRNYTGSTSKTVSGVAYLGEWIQLHMPVSVRADKLVMSKPTSGLDERQVGSGCRRLGRRYDVVAHLGAPGRCHKAGRARAAPRYRRRCDWLGRIAAHRGGLATCGNDGESHQHRGRQLHFFGLFIQ